MSGILIEKIVKNEQIGPAIYRMKIASAYISQHAAPGQFVNIKCCDGINALLRRPISICTVNPAEGTIDIVYQIKGTGTELLAGKQPGERVDIIGPLGTPFDLSEKYKRIAVVGGGIGIFPMLCLLQNSRAEDKHAFLGFRSSDFIVLKDEFEQAADVSISTDDGTAGYHGLVTDLLEKELVKGKFDLIYACGPMPMIRKAAALAEQYSALCQVSMEQRMGCGIGACLVCACKTKAGAGDEWEYSHVCKDGPVFWSTEVIFE
jgi:dihydroorotate dehydrogenase electron transfer subunit